jgi:transposase
MPKLLRAGAPEDADEEQKIRKKLAGSRHAPGDRVFRARIVSLSWQGSRTTEIAEELGCHPKTVRKHLHRFNAEGMDGLADHPGAGRRPRSLKSSVRGSSLWSLKTRRVGFYATRA